MLTDYELRLLNENVPALAFADNALGNLISRLQDGTDIEDGAITGDHLAAGATGNTVPLPIAYYVIAIPNTAGNVDTVVTKKCRVVEVRFVKQNATGVGSAKTLTIKNGTTNAITEAMDLAVVDKTVVRASTIDDAYQDIAANGTLRATVATTGQDASGLLYVGVIHLT